MAVEFKDYSLNVKAAINDETMKWLRETAFAIASHAKENCTMTDDGGQLRRSYRAEVDEAKGEAYIGSSLESAYWEEFGTGEYALEGNGRKGYWVYVKDSDSGKMSKSSKSYTLAEARRIMAMLRADGLEAYYTKGTRPKRMLYKSFKMWKPKIQARAKQIFKERGF